MLSSLYLVCVMVFFLSHIPRVPEFQWKERGHPQVPQPWLTNNFSQNPQEKEHIYLSEKLAHLFGRVGVDKGENLGNGQWVPFQSEYLLNQKEMKIYIPQLSEFPRIISVSYFDTQGKKQGEKSLIVNQPGWVRFVNPLTDDCIHNVSPAHFCSYRIRIDKNRLRAEVFYSQVNVL